MLRVLQATVALMGGLLLMIAGMVAKQRADVEAPLRWMVICCQRDRQGQDALYLFEPVSGTTQHLSAYAENPQLIKVRDGWFYYYATDAEGVTKLYRTRVGATPQAIFGFGPEENANPLIVSNDGQWLVYNGSNDNGDHWYSHSIHQDTTHELTAELSTGDPVGYVSGLIPIFRADGQSVYLQVLDRERRTFEIYRARLDGSASESLTATLEEDALIVGIVEGGLVVRLALPEPPFQ